MEGYHSPQVPVDVRLNTNESPFPPPPEFTERLAAELAGVAWHRYPDRSASTLRTGIARLHDVQPDQVFAANGSNEVLQTLLLTYAGPGRSVVTFEPTYALHSHIARVTGATVVECERGEDFELLVDDVEELLDRHRPAVVFLCSPNNPTGLLEPPDVVRAVARRAAEDGFVLVVDEAYGQFSPWSALELLDDDIPLVVTRTYSKTWSMAAARLGYLVGPSWLVTELEKVVLPYHLDVVTQLAGTLALDYAPEMSERVSVVVEERGRLQAALADLPVQAWPSAANFLLFRPLGRSGDEVWQGLVDRSVLVRNCASWPRLEHCLRVTVGTKQENDAFLAALKEVLS
jgi:histidinol-phosphate aminotransferase